MEVLLFGAVGAITALLTSAWIMTFAHIYPTYFLREGRIIDFKSLVRGHVDYAMMAIFCLVYYAVGIDLTTISCWCITIGAISNPIPFIIGAFDINYKEKKGWRVFMFLSFFITTVGHGWAAYTILFKALEIGIPNSY